MSHENVYQSHLCNQHQVFYENPEFIDEEELFNGSDEFESFPVLRTVPSYDIQELFMRNPIASRGPVAPPPRRRRFYAGGRNAFCPEFVQHLRPRLPPHLKNHYAKRSPPYQQLNTGFPSWNEETITDETSSSFRRENGIYLNSAPAISARSRMLVPKELTKLYVKPYQARSSSRPSTPIPRTGMTTSSEPITNYQDRFGAATTDDAAEFRNRTRRDRLVEESAESDAERLKKMNSEGDATGAAADVEDFDAIGRIAVSLDGDEADKLSDKQKMEIREMSKILKPRVPSSVRSLQNGASVTTTESRIVNDGNAVAEAEGDKFQVTFRKSLDSILNQLESCESSLNEVRSKFSSNRKVSAKPSSETVVKNEIFNLRDITEKLGNENDEKMVRNQDEEVPKIGSSDTMEDVSSGFASRGVSKGTILDDSAALDLHRSKSYIVNLIDRALSKELGTVSNESRDRFQDLNPIRAVRTIERNRRKDTIVCNCNNSSNVKEEEPSYIKQLKHLRWGHFKHIQKEVRRLEDLERFLDNCNTSENVTF